MNIASSFSRLLKWELDHPVDEDGTHSVIVKKSTFLGGGLGYPLLLNKLKAVNTYNVRTVVSHLKNQSPWSTFVTRALLVTDILTKVKAIQSGSRSQRYC